MLNAKPPVPAGAEEEYTPSGRSLVAAVAAVAATYVYFLIFAQFGFLRTLTETLGRGPEQVRPILAAMGAAGIAGSVFAARAWTEARGRSLMTAGFLLAGLAAALSQAARGPALFFLCAALTGGGTGVATVGLAAMMRRAVGVARLGRCLGLGTGLAYGICNLPPVFGGSARLQAALAVAAVVTGRVAVAFLAQRAPPVASDEPGYARPDIARWTALLFVLVAFDSGAFYVIQQSPALKAANWTGGLQLGLVAAVHLAAGWFAGVSLDRSRINTTVAAGAGLLLVGGWLVGAPAAPVSLPALLYAAGVSVYSTVLVHYPARSGRPRVAAGVYAVAGWIGSAAGIAALGGGGQIPGWWTASAALAAGLLLVARGRVQN